MLTLSNNMHFNKLTTLLSLTTIFCVISVSVQAKSGFDILEEPMNAYNNGRKMMNEDYEMP